MLGGLTTGELARRCGVSRNTVRAYEREGLLRPVRRTASGYRVFVPEDLLRVGFIRQAQAFGLTLDDMRGLLAGRAAAAGNPCRRVAARLQMRLQDVDEKLACLVAFRQRLAASLEACEEVDVACLPLIFDLVAGGIRPAPPQTGRSAPGGPVNETPA